MSKQTDALQVADALDADRLWLAKRGLHQQSMAEAAVELRRLHALNAELLKALEKIEKLPGISSANLYARQAIPKATGEQK